MRVYDYDRFWAITITLVYATILVLVFYHELKLYGWI